MASTSVLLLIIIPTTLGFNIETQLDIWCQEPMKTVDLNSFNSNINAVIYQKVFEHRCAITLRNIPRKIWNRNLTELLQQPFASKLSVLKISDSIRVEDENFFKIETRLKYLDLSGNDLDFLPLPEEDNRIPTVQKNIFDHLYTLDLSNNKFTNISFVKGSIFNLRELDLGGNRFRQVPTESLLKFVDLEKLSLKKNNITSIQKSQQYLNLKYLDLSGNHLKNLEGCDKYISLRVLLVSYNDIKTLHPRTFENGIWSLEELHLDHNNITDISKDAFAYFPNLKSLKLNNNRISNLELKVFATLKSLESLDISNNYLTILNMDLFASQKNLVILNMRNNLIESLNYARISKTCPSLKEVDILGNNFKCEFFEELFFFFTKHNIIITDGDLCLPKANASVCCDIKAANFSKISNETESFAMTRNEYKSNPINLIFGSTTSYNISRFLSSIEDKSEYFLTLFFYQFAFIVFVSLFVLLVYVHRNCRYKTDSSKSKSSELHKMIHSI